MRCESSSCPLSSIAQRENSGSKDVNRCCASLTGQFWSHLLFPIGKGDGLRAGPNRSHSRSLGTLPLGIRRVGSSTSL